MLASPLLPSPGFPEDAAQYRPAKDLDAFNSLLPPPIDFVEGSSSGALATAEGKYQPINTAPKTPKVETYEVRKGVQSTPHKSPKAIHAQSKQEKSLYAGSLSTAWPSGTVVGAGLHNTGNTCFLNSALQCLLHTPPLLHILLIHAKNDPCRVPKGAFCMSCSLRQVMMESHQKQHSFTPYPITIKLQVIAKHMRRGRQEDSHEFLRYAVDALQKSCLAGYPPKIDPKIAETTWVHKIFGGRLRSRVTCLECGHNSDTFDSILDLSIDIYGVSGLKEALRKFVAIDHLKGADKYKCEKCKKPVTADKQFTVHEAPLVLTIHLKRFSPMGRKIGHLIKYDEQLSLQPVMSEEHYGPTYSLYGVISHAGGGPNSGHYYAHVKGANGGWFEMNDDSVTRHAGAPTSMKNAYILFYIRSKGQALEAAVNASDRVTPQPKSSVVASMKKRKVIESDDDDMGRSAESKTLAPFIGPQLPSPPTPVEPSSVVATQEKPKAGDPQADLLKKRIAAVSQSPSKALQSLTQYEDDEDDIGEKVDKDSVLPASTEPVEAASLPVPPSSTTTQSTEPARRTSGIGSVIPASSFYGASTSRVKAKDSSGSKKRKSSDGDGDDGASLSEWARTPLSPGLSSSSPAKERRHSGPRFSGGMNPYTRLRGSNNLQQPRESTSSPLRRYGRKRRLIM
ncbi:hypothetical protein AcV5_001328 [Taiwanofungus camphoratus]|nr:hypothetical protein AcV5_001328 [Antrodia cinnamomea]